MRPTVLQRPRHETLRRMRAFLVRSQRRWRSPLGREALEWLRERWDVTEDDLRRLGVGVVRRGPTWALVVPSSRGGETTGLKLYVPRWRELGLDHKATSVVGSSPRTIGGHRLAEAAGRIVLVVGGEKDVLVADAALARAEQTEGVVVVAHAGGESAWKQRRGGVEVAVDVVGARPARIVVALDVNEHQEGGGAGACVAALLAAGGSNVRVAVWPEAFAAAHPEGGVAQLVLGEGGSEDDDGENEGGEGDRALLALVGEARLAPGSERPAAPVVPGPGPEAIRAITGAVPALVARWPLEDRRHREAGAGLACHLLRDRGATEGATRFVLALLTAALRARALAEGRDVPSHLGGYAASTLERLAQGATVYAGGVLDQRAPGSLALVDELARELVTAGAATGRRREGVAPPDEARERGWAEFLESKDEQARIARVLLARARAISDRLAELEEADQPDEVLEPLRKQREELLRRADTAAVAAHCGDVGHERIYRGCPGGPGCECRSFLLRQREWCGLECCVRCAPRRAGKLVAALPGVWRDSLREHGLDARLAVARFRLGREDQDRDVADEVRTDVRRRLGPLARKRARFVVGPREVLVLLLPDDSGPAAFERSLAELRALPGAHVEALALDEVSARVEVVLRDRRATIAHGLAEACRLEREALEADEALGGAAGDGQRDEAVLVRERLLATGWVGGIKATTAGLAAKRVLRWPTPAVVRDWRKHGGEPALAEGPPPVAPCGALLCHRPMSFRTGEYLADPLPSPLRFRDLARADASARVAVRTPRARRGSEVTGDPRRARLRATARRIHDRQAARRE